MLAAWKLDKAQDLCCLVKTTYFRALRISYEIFIFKLNVSALLLVCCYKFADILDRCKRSFSIFYKY